MEKVYLKNFGCKVNAAELLEAAEELDARKFDSIEVQSHVDLPANATGTLIVNSCTVTATADAKLRAFVRRVQKRSPNVKVVVGGCSVRNPQFDFSTLGTANIVPRVKTAVERLVESAVPSHLNENGNFGKVFAKQNQERSRAFIRMQDGCDSKCSFCIIPSVRPAESLQRGEILARLDRALEHGAKEVVLTGTNIGKYEDGESRGFLKIVYEFLERAESASARIRISSIEPEDVKEEVFEVFEHPALCAHLHLPLQSGSGRVLSLMRRRYNINRYRKIVAEMRKRFPSASVTTDIIVGFPGETDEDFAETLAVMTESGFERVHVFRFSPRPGTPAADMKSAPERTAHARMEKAIAHSDKIIADRMKRHVGANAQVLVEETIGNMGVGYTGEYFRACIDGLSGEKGGLVQVILGEPDGAGLFSAKIASGFTSSDESAVGRKLSLRVS